MYIRILTVAATALLLSACATYSSNSVDKKETPATEAAKPTSEADIIVTESDITDRKYTVLGDITATVNKTTIFHPDPTPALVAKELREEAAKLGADAVVLVRYGDVGVSLLS